MANEKAQLNTLYAEQFVELSDEELGMIEGGYSLSKMAQHLVTNIVIGGATGALGGPAGIGVGIVGGMIAAMSTRP